MHKYFMLFIALLSVTGNVISQNKSNKEIKQHSIVKKNEPADYDMVYCRRAETEPRFGADSTAWNKYLQQQVNTNIPKMNGAPVGRYEVSIQFIVDKYGVIVEPPVPLTHLGYGMEEEVIRIIKASPQWTPATLNGRVVSYRMRQSFSFTVSEPLITRAIHITSNEQPRSNT